MRAAYPAAAPDGNAVVARRQSISWTDAERLLDRGVSLSERCRKTGALYRAGGAGARGQWSAVRSPRRPAKVYEAGVAERTVVIEFASVAKAIEVYESAEYQKAVEALGDGAERDLRVLEAFA
jgi:hypothetical protein